MQCQTVAYVPCLLKSMTDICKQFGVGRKQVRAWIRAGAPIAVEGDGARTKYSAELLRKSGGSGGRVRLRRMRTRRGAISGAGATDAEYRCRRPLPCTPVYRANEESEFRGCRPRCRTDRDTAVSPATAPHPIFVGRCRVDAREHEPGAIPSRRQGRKRLRAAT